MPGKGDPWGNKKRRARDIQRRVLPKTEQQDTAARERLLGALDAAGPEGQARMHRRGKAAAQLPRFKKADERYESPYTGIMLSSAGEFDTFTEFFRDAELQPADIKCDIGKPFADCETLQDVRDKITGEGKFAGKEPTVIKRGKHEFTWTVYISQQQYDALDQYYRGPDKGAKR